ncbi:hypothetical protein L6164_008348 [Bauhinia variegata]|uniref:Uncharacterized protein n=1 Tax=Bauhinia variegata TaxID=167791 RepID=A0ACB9PGC7_BAUVA|nr:hypothetical protein L6164_008348 [Bauhinia variegata]
MDSGLVHSRVDGEYGQDHQPQNAGLQHGGDEHHHDIKSVLKKAKAKAKKIKNTITKNRHGHDQDHDHGYHDEGQHVPDDHVSYDEDDEDEGTVENPEVHGAPVYESAAIENLGHPGVNVGGTTATGEEHHKEPRTAVVSSSAESNLNGVTEPAGTFVREDNTRQLAEVNLDRPMGLDEHPYQSKVTDPTGAGDKELYTTPVEDSLARMNIDNEPKPNTVLPIGSGIQYPSAGRHDELSPEPTPTPTNSFKFPEYPQETGKISDTVIEPEEHPRSETTEKPEFPQEIAKTFDAMTQPEEYPHHETLEKPSTQSSYTEKVPSAASEIADEGTSAENVAASKLGYGEKGNRDKNEMKQEEKPSNQSSYTEKMSSATSAIADKVISAKNIVASKLGYGEKDDRENKENEMKHEERNIEPSNQGSYTEKISSATSAIADKAISAKNVVTSKLLYGEKGDRDNKETTHVKNESGDAATKPESTLEYGKKIASTVTEKLTPVYGAVAGVGSAVMSKMPGTGTGTETRTDSGSEENEIPKQDKGVSVKDYLAEKLRPGDEDRALSEVISEAYHKRKKDPMEGLGHENRAKTEQDRPLGKVTESEEVKRHLGIDKDEKGSEESHVNSPGKGVVEKLKGAVGSWFGKTEAPPSSEVADERKLHESN